MPATDPPAEGPSSFAQVPALSVPCAGDSLWSHLVDGSTPLRIRDQLENEIAEFKFGRFKQKWEPRICAFSDEIEVINWLRYLLFYLRHFPSYYNATNHCSCITTYSSNDVNTRKECGHFV